MSVTHTSAPGTARPRRRVRLTTCNADCLPTASASPGAARTSGRGRSSVDCGSYAGWPDKFADIDNRVDSGVAIYATTYRLARPHRFLAGEPSGQHGGSGTPSRSGLCVLSTPPIGLDARNGAPARTFQPALLANRTRLLWRAPRLPSEYHLDPPPAYRSADVRLPRRRARRYGWPGLPSWRCPRGAPALGFPSAAAVAPRAFVFQDEPAADDPVPPATLFQRATALRR